MIFLQLAYEFFKAGLFSVGGGLATLPFLHDIAARYDWFDEAMLLDMIAVSESTPGPIGVNMATYAGYQAAGVAGGIVATLALVAPSIIVILIIARFLGQFRDNVYVQDAFYGLRPVVTALIAAAGFQMIQTSLLSVDVFRITGKLSDIVDLKALILFLAVLFATNKWNRHPVIYLAGAAVVGMLFRF